MAACERLVEVLPGGLRVVALGGPGAEDGAGGRAVLRLAEKLLVGPALELLDGGEAAHPLLHLDLALLGHGPSVWQTGRLAGRRTRPSQSAATPIGGRSPAWGFTAASA